MSLTLRDGQHLSWKTFKKLEKVDEKLAANLGTGPDLVKKAEDIAKKIETTAKSNSVSKDEVGKLLSEILFSSFIIAERMGVSLEDSFLQAVDEIILGFVS